MYRRIIMDKELVQQFLLDLCDSALSNIDFENPDEGFGGMLTLQYIRDNNREIIEQLDEWSRP